MPPSTPPGAPPEGERAMSDLVVEVSRSRSIARGEQHALVLVAVGIDCRLAWEDGSARLYVAPADAERARRQIGIYEVENRPRRRPSQLRPLLGGLDAALAYCALLLLAFGIARRGMGGIDWVMAGAAHKGLIVDGAWWRTITALTLHADLGHLASNLASGALFGLLVAQLFGPGLAWLAILAAGALGNGLNALIQPAVHLSIGASTAVFGALGILSGHMFRSREIPWRGGMRRWAPLGGGLMLLVFIGVGGERTDVWAHALGFLAGVGIGAALAQLAWRIPHGPRAQAAYALAALALIALAWLLAVL
jgi:rhomboid protease GluP